MTRHVYETAGHMNITDYCTRHSIDLHAAFSIFQTGMKTLLNLTEAVLIIRAVLQRKSISRAVLQRKKNLLERMSFF